MKIDLVFLCLLLFIVYHVYMSNKIESMTDVSVDIKDTIKQIYLADVEAIRNLSNVATQLQAGGLTIPGDLTIGGKLNVSSDITSANLIVTSSFNMIPKGTIIAFNSENAPNGWALCDGTNGTPDLRGRFIRMHSTSLGGYNEWGGKVLGGNVTAYEKSIGGNSRDDPNTWMLNHKFGDRAGTDHHQLHINEIPPHSHIINSDYKLMTPITYKRGLSGGGFDGYDAGGGSTQPIPANSVGTTNTGGGWGHNNQPPYYVLSYIMKI